MATTSMTRILRNAALAIALCEGVFVHGLAPHLHARALVGPEELSDSYDYVIVGGGTAGLTVADRLSEDAETTVLVIESGALYDSDQINLVRDRLVFMTDLTMFHMMQTVPNKELNNKSTLAFVGNVVGGSSAVNGMQAPRGTRHEYDRWGRFFDDPDDSMVAGTGGGGSKGKSSWSWEGMLPYFKKGTHRQTPTQAALDVMPYFKAEPSYWGQEESTRVYTGWPTFQYPGVKYQIEALAQVPGVQFPEDAGAGEAGVYWYPTFFDGEGSFNRSYARTGHWDGIDHRPNYHLLDNSVVTKIEIDSDSKRATGVTFRGRYDTNSTTPILTTVKADKEVIVSAGTYHSPQILQLSGIGPRKLLEEAGIEVKVDLPGVGQNLHDHTTVNMTYAYKNFTLRPNRRDDMVAQNPDFLAWADHLWATNHTGPWSRQSFNVGAWLPLTVMTSPQTYESLASAVEAQIPDAANLLPDGADSDPAVVAGHRARLQAMTDSIRSPNVIFYQQGFTGDEPNYYFTYENPLSAGSVNINVSAPAGQPVIDWRTYSNPVDFDVLIAMCEFHRKLNLESPVYRDFLPEEVTPGLQVSSRDEWIGWIRESTEPSAMHPTGTCGMMPRDLGGVVDEQLRVYGVDGLRVVDASVMNMLVGVNLCQTVYAIAEKAADHIKGLIV